MSAHGEPPRLFRLLRSPAPLRPALVVWRLRAATLSLCAERHRRRLDPAVAAVALLVRDNRVEQIAPAEIGPQRLGDPNLGVGDLPEEEVADAHLAARADQQIRIRLAGGVEELAEA